MVHWLYMLIAVPHFPNSNAIAKQCSNGNLAIENQLTVYAASCVQPGFDYFKSKLTLLQQSNFSRQLGCFHQSRCKLTTQQWMKLNNPTALANLKAELHAQVCDLDPGVDIFEEWWKRHEQTNKDVLLVQSSSAASERVFWTPSTIHNNIWRSISYVVMTLSRTIILWTAEAITLPTPL